MGFKKFPSEDAYKAYYRIYASFKEMIKDEINDENLVAHVETRAGNLLGLARADVEIILCSAYDFRKGRFIEDGWERAGRRAIEAWNRLADGEPWDAVLEEYSEVYTPPIGVSSRQYADKVDSKKGRFGLLNRNTLMQKMGESDFSTFLNGSSLTDTIFFDVEAGVPEGPFKGPQGYYIVLVKSRTPPGSQINVLPGEGGHRNLVEQDYLDCRINQFGNQLLNEMAVKGF